MRTERSGIKRLGIATVAVAALAGSAYAQQGWEICFDPMNTQPVSPDNFALAIANSMMFVGVGVSGTATFGGAMGPCFIPAVTEQQSGFLFYGTGTVGSLHSGHDDGCVQVMGAPWGGHEWAYATIRTIDSNGQTTDTRFAGYGARAGASGRYIEATATINNVNVRLTVTVAGAISRWQWDLTNVDTASQQVGLRYACWSAMINNFYGSSGFGDPNYILLNTGRAVELERDTFRSTNPNAFPKSVEFMFRQADPYPSTRIPLGPNAIYTDATNVDRLTIGNPANVHGGAGTGGGEKLWEPAIVPDNGMGATSYAIFFNPTFLAPNATRRIVYYIEQGWSNNVFNTPGFNSQAYTLTAEAPRLITYNPGAGDNDLDPNPFFISAWVDNMYPQYANDQTLQLPLKDVNFTLTLPPGLTFAPGETPTKSISQINPVEDRSVRWRVVADGSISGALKYKVSTSTQFSGSNTVEGTVQISATPKVNIVTGPQLVTFPWVFSDPNIQNFTGLTVGSDLLGIFDWNVTTQSYNSATNAVRGKGQWIVSNADFPNTTFSGAADANDELVGNFRFTVRRGWNLIGNPYPIQVTLDQMWGVDSANPGKILTWSDMVDLGKVRGVLFRYDPNIGNYTFTSDTAQPLPPHVGYWIYVNSTTNIDLFWPPIFAPGLPGSTRSNPSSDNNWKIQIVARGNGKSDVSNFIGVAPNANLADKLSLPEPPDAPNTKFRLSMDRENSDPEFWAQDIREVRPRITYKLRFVAYEAGSYSLTWPNISDLPRSVRARLVDKDTGVSRDLRGKSSYSFGLSSPGTRNFELSIEPGAATRPVIGAVQFSGGGRGPAANLTIQYTLSASAEVGVRILSTAGKEVSVISQLAALNAGTQVVSWNLHDSRGRAVAPGTYVVEIVAQTPEGQRVRKTQPVIVTR